MLEKRQYLPQYLSDNGFKGTVVNQQLPSLLGRSLKNYTYSAFKV